MPYSQSSQIKSSSLAAALGEPNSQQSMLLIWSHFVVVLKPGLDVKQSHLSLLNKSSCSVAASGVTKFLIIIIMNLVTLCYYTQVRLVGSTNPPRKSKSDLSSTTKCDRIASGVLENRFTPMCDLSKTCTLTK